MLYGERRLVMADKLKNYILLRNGKVIYTKYKTYDYKAVWHVRGPNTDYAFTTFDKNSCFQGTQVLDASDDFLDFLRNGDLVQFSHIGGWYEVYIPFDGCIFIVSNRTEYKTTNENGEEVVYINPEYTRVHDEMKEKIRYIKKKFKIQGWEGKDKLMTYYKNVNGVWEFQI